jgi:DnaK suppressor protein
MRERELAELRETIERRRRQILEAARRTDSDIDALRGADDDVEMESRAQNQQEQFTLAQLGEVERRELAQIDATLRRLEAGSYGTCRQCGEPIAASRLRALPHALDCAECAGRSEEGEKLEREKLGRPRRMTPG